MSVDYSRDPDDLYNDSVVCKLLITAWRSTGIVKITGHAFYKAYAIQMLENARLTVIKHNQIPRTLPLVPPEICEIEISVRKNGNMSTAGQINDLPYALKMIDNALDEMKRPQARRLIDAGGNVVVPGRETGLIT